MQILIDISEHEWEYLNKLVANGDQLGHYERLLVGGEPIQEPKTGHCKNCKHFWCIEDCESVTLCNKYDMKVSKNFYCKDFEMSEVK